VHCYSGYVRTQSDIARKGLRLRLRVVRISLALGLSAAALGACGAHNEAAPAASGDKLLLAALQAQTRGETALATTDYLALLETQPKTTLAWYNLGVLAHEAHNDQGAVRDYESAIGTNETYFPALYNLAILVTATDPKRAEQLYVRAIAVRPNDADAYLNLGFVERTLGYAGSARIDISHAIRLDPSLGAR
jgi:tetratricopeptide (TPR) repeat protein